MSENLKNGGRGLTTHVPDEIAVHRPDIKRIFDAMIFKLHRNRHKGRWEDIDLEKAISKLVGECVELEEAIKNGNTSEIVMEAADVANWALIITNIALDRKDV